MAKQILKHFIDKTIVLSCRKNANLRSLINYIAKSIGTDDDGYESLKKKFIQNGRQTKWDQAVREKIISKFEVIDRKVPSGTTSTDGLFLAEALLSMDADGSIVECGCYAGSSTAKISIITKLLNKSLFVFDSFEGLPEVDEANIRDVHARRSSGWVTDWSAGRYAAGLEQVKINVEKYGEISVCSFFKGWFNETLKDENLPDKIAFAFTDVDIASSARDCFLAIWPKLLNKGVYFSHDVAYIKVLQAILNRNLWQDVLKEFPPILFGGGYGLNNYSPHLGFFVKGESITAEYIKSLTIDK